jgi:hypothetical protein
LNKDQFGNVGALFANRKPPQPQNNVTRKTPPKGKVDVNKFGNVGALFANRQPPQTRKSPPKGLGQPSSSPKAKSPVPSPISNKILSDIHTDVKWIREHLTEHFKKDITEVKERCKDNEELINGKCLKKCAENQERNPKTNRCTKKKQSPK